MRSTTVHPFIIRLYIAPFENDGSIFSQYFHQKYMMKKI